MFLLLSWMHILLFSRLNIVGGLEHIRGSMKSTRLHIVSVNVL
jgi:hypothetical protein